MQELQQKVMLKGGSMRTLRGPTFSMQNKNKKTNRQTNKQTNKQKNGRLIPTAKRGKGTKQ